MNAYLQTVSSCVNQSNLSHCFVLKVKKYILKCYEHMRQIFSRFKKRTAYFLRDLKFSSVSCDVQKCVNLIKTYNLNVSY